MKFFTENGSIVVCPSGTEPKLKTYISVTAENESEEVTVEKNIADCLEEHISRGEL